MQKKIYIYMLSLLLAAGCNDKGGSLNQNQLPVPRKVRVGILGSVQGRSHKCLKQKLKARYYKSSFKLKTRFIIKLSSGSTKEGKTAAYINYKFFNRLNRLIIAIIPLIALIARSQRLYLLIALIALPQRSSQPVVHALAARVARRYMTFGHPSRVS